MDEHSVAFNNVREMCIQNTNSKKKDLELSPDIFLKDTSCSQIKELKIHKHILKTKQNKTNKQKNKIKTR